jgi:hypothetical protein
MRALLHQAQLPTQIRQQLWAEAAHHATNIINAKCTPLNKEPPYKLFYGKDPSYAKALKTFGEIVVASTAHNKIKSKAIDRGTLTIYIGRAVDHPYDTYRLFNLKTKKLILNRNTKFINKTYADYFHGNNQYKELIDYNDTDEYDEDDDVEEIHSAKKNTSSLNFLSQTSKWQTLREKRNNQL